MPAEHCLEDLITTVKGVGPATAEKLSRLKIITVRDLLYHFPSRYNDFSHKTTISNLKVGQAQVFLATLNNCRSFFSHSGKLLTEATVSDKTGKTTLIWFNSPYLKNSLRPKETYTIAGKVSAWNGKVALVAPLIEPSTQNSVNTTGLVPTFPQTEGLTSKFLRHLIHTILESTKINDPLSPEILEPLRLMSQSTALHSIHFPADQLSQCQADKRLAFNEHLRISIENQVEQAGRGPSIALTAQPKIEQKTLKKIPFVLTSDQTKTIKAIYRDLSQTNPTHRLIQGDTGSGKTVTLIFAANQCLSQGLSCAIMAPTEILANQHYRTFCSLGLFPQQTHLITGHRSVDLVLDKPAIYIGTHALITQLPAELKHPLAFLAIDEQHKFGVKQRDELLNRQPVPHLFNLSATPIPRTVALGLLGEIKISNISHRPQNRLATKTFVITPSHFQKSPAWLTEKLDSGNHIFVVCPNISEHTTDVASVEKMSQKYRKIIPPQFPIHTIHGKMKPAEQEKTLNLFQSAPSGVLIATSLIEVGIDISTANVIIIHSAERFGLAALHQLRGRVGRGEGQGYCFLVPSRDDEVEVERLKLLQKYHSGLVLAQKDLRLRGAGEVFGLKQHGSLPTRLKYFWSKKLFLLAKNLAGSLIKKDSAKALQIAAKLSTC